MRPMTLPDVEACSAVFEHEGVDPANLPGPAFLRRVLRFGSGFGVVFERIAPSSGGPHLVAFGCTAFVHPTWGERAKALAEQSRVLEASGELELQTDALLSAAAVAKANAGDGLIGLLYGARGDQRLSEEQRREVSCLMSQALLAAHAGYNFREFLWLGASRELAVFLANGGGPTWMGDTNASVPELYGLSRADSDRARGSLFYSLFDYRKPTLFFSDAHRELIWLALQGYSDEQIGAIAGISGPGVKKRWSSLFDHVTDRRGDLLPGPSGNGVRGPVKRAALLEYVRLHPEELRPNAGGPRRAYRPRHVA